jgi:glucose 1-dehydrogenase
MAARQSVARRCLVDQRTARGVDQSPAAFDQGEGRRVDHPLGFGVSGRCKDETSADANIPGRQEPDWNVRYRLPAGVGDRRANRLEGRDQAPSCGAKTGLASGSTANLPMIGGQKRCCWTFRRRDSLASRNELGREITMTDESTRILAGQKALVTGANSGIGEAVAIALGQAGADVVVNYVTDEERAEAVVAEIRRSGVRACAHRADVSAEDQVQEMFRRAVADFGTLDILINNAGLQRDAPFSSMSLQQWNTVIDVNLTGQFLCSREAVREFLRRGVVPAVSRAAGKIICISSVHEIIPWAGHANYAASKGGVSMMMRTLAQEVAPQRIRVNGVAPGAVRTSINTAAWSTDEAYRQLMTLVPYKRIGEPEDIARAVVWLASDQSDYVVGATLFVDGGMTLFPDFAEGG